MTSTAGRSAVAAHDSVPETSEKEAATATGLLVLFFVTLIIPGTVTVAGLTVGTSRIYLLVMFVPLFLRWASGQAGRITAADIFVLLYCFWIWAALFSNHGMGRIHSAGIQFVEMFGGYLVGRVLVRSAVDYRLFVRCMFGSMVFLLPFAIVELLTGWSPLRAVAEAVMTVDERKENTKARLGFAERVQGPFAHSILFGLFCSLGVANFFFTYRDAFVKRVVRMGIALSLVFVSLSSAPMISAGLQLMMIGWDRIFFFFRTRWVVLVILAVTIIGGFQLLYPGGILVFIFENLLLMPQTGYGRLEIFYWGSRSVMDNPIFGVGQGEWERAYWMGHPTIDNFWLATAVRFGLPTLIFLWIAIALNVLGILGTGGLDYDEMRQRRGYLIAVTGLVMILATVSVWGPVSTFVLTYFGAGSWFYTRAGRRVMTPVERRAQRGSRIPRQAPPGSAGPETPAIARASQSSAEKGALRPSRAGVPERRPRAGGTGSRPVRTQAPPTRGRRG